MYRIKTLNKISSVGLSKLDRDRFQVGGDVENEDGILVRSAPMHDYEFPGIGSDHIYWREGYGDYHQFKKIIF